MIKPLNASGDEDAVAVRDLQAIVSPSRLSLFHQCRLKFYFRYVKELEKPKSPALHLGSCVHAVLKVWNKARWRGIGLTMKQLEIEYLRAWSEDATAVDWDENEEADQRTGWALLQLYLAQPVRQAGRPEAVEVPVEADLSASGLPRLVGVLDLVERGKIVDYKTSATTPVPAKVAHLNEIQTTAYAILYRETTGKTEQGIEIHTLVKLKSPKVVVAELPTVTEPQKIRFLRLTESYVNGLQRRDWVPSPGLQCTCCEYFHECRNWS